MKYAVSGLISVLLLPLSSQSFAQAATLSDCQAIQDRLARYACYDKWDSASGVRQSVPAARPNTTSASEQEDETSSFGRVSDRDSEEATVASESAPATMETFGRNETAASSARLVEGDEGSELIDTITALEQRGPSMWLITLQSGQQWQQMISKRYPLAVGDEVRIYPTRWGNAFRLSSEEVGSYIQVERVDNGQAVAASPALRPREEAAPQVEQDDEPSLLGRMGSRIGGLFSRDDDQAEEVVADEAVAEAAEAAPAPSTVAGFGRNESGASNARLVEGDEGAELIDTIVALEQRGPSMWVVTLQSGQRWQQMISKRYPLAVGDEVRIYPTRWGNSFRLSSEKAGSYIQVERID